jgi:hypothetical protein
MSENVPPPEHHTADDLLPSRVRRFIPLLAVIGISLGVVGFLTGIRERPAAPRENPPAVGSGPVPAAVNYSELPGANLRPNANWNQSLAEMKFDRPGIFEPVVRTEEMKLAALADRAKNRDYDGAPPTIPHPTLMRGECASCHGVFGADGIKTTHPWRQSCTQCHAMNAVNDQHAAVTP